MKRSPVILALAGCLAGLLSLPASAQNTNDLSKMEITGNKQEIAGQVLVQKILKQCPAQDFTNTGTFKIRDTNGKTHAVPVSFTIIATPTNWVSFYFAGDTSLTTTHTLGQANTYLFQAENGKIVSLSSHELMMPFAGSDFWLADLGLDFFHWPDQKVLRREVHRSCGCSVLECTNPDPTTNGYSRVDLWIDNDSLGIVDAYAYDALGKELKNFYPKDLKKINGQYQVESMLMENSQTGTRTRLEFDLKSK